MDSPAFPLVQTKTLLPATRPQLVQRPDLIRRLTDESYASVILVCAPAGYGKTTVLTDYARDLEKKDWAVAWYSIESDDDQTNIFGAYLLQCLYQAIGSDPFFAQIGQVLRVSNEIDLKQLMTPLINAIARYKRQVLLVLDDYHLIESREIRTAVSFLADHLPENWHLAIGSRTEPDFSLPRLRARGKLIEIRSNDLQFSIEEIDELLNEKNELHLSEEAIKKLQVRTEGWISGLQLAALSLKKSKNNENLLADVSGVNPYLASYLMEEVLSGQSAEKQTFLKSTSILERLCGPLCEALIDSTSDSEAILRELAANNLFIVPLDEKGCWYRYHHLFREFLLANLSKTGEGISRTLHQRASEWLADNGYTREAAGHAFSCGDLDYAARFVERHCFSLIIHSEIAALSDWSSRFPEEVLNRHPLLYVYQCWGLVFSFQKKVQRRIDGLLRKARSQAELLDDSKMVFEIVENEQVIRQMMLMIPDPTADASRMLAEAQEFLREHKEADAGQFSFLLTSGYAYMAMKNVDLAGQVLEKARTTAVEARLYFGIIESSFQLSRLAHWQGNYGEAIRICGETKAEMKRLLDQPEKEIPGIACLDIAIGCAMFERGKNDEAEKKLLFGLQSIGWGMNPYYCLVGNLCLFKLYECEGRKPDADAILDNLEMIWPEISFLTRGLIIHRNLKTHIQDYEVRKKAETWSVELSDHLSLQGGMPGIGPFGGCEIYYLAAIVWIQIQILSGNTEKAGEILEKYLEEARVSGMKQRFDELSEIWRWFNREDGLTDGMRKEEQGKESLLVCQLSERETEILGLMGEGASNLDIAERLVITIGTVKTHVNHILSKLNVKNRTQAVARGRQLGLIE